MYDTLLIVPDEGNNNGEAIGRIVSLFRRSSLNPGVFLVSRKNKDKNNRILSGGPSGCIAGTGTLSDLYFRVSAGKIETRSLWWISDPGDILQNQALIRELWNGLETGYNLVIAVRPSVPPPLKIPGMAIFPEWKDPYSGHFLVEKEVFVEYATPRLRGPLLPHLLSRVPWNEIFEVPVRGSEKTRAGNNFGQASWLYGFVQILYYAISEKKSPLRVEIGKIVRFALVGISGILVNTGFLYIFTEISGFFYLASSAIAIELSILTNFVLNDFWTFKSRSGLIRQRWKRLVSYNFLALGGMAVNMVVLYGLTAGFGVYYLYANIIGIIFAFLWNYLTNRNITWK